MKKYISLGSFFLFLLIIFNLVQAHEPSSLTLITGNQIVIEGKTITAGITPDNLLYPLDVALDKLSLLLTFDPTAKARKGLEIARERLLEVREMIIQNKFQDAEKARAEHRGILNEIENSITALKTDNSTEELKRTLEIEKEIEEHEDEVNSVLGEAVLKVKVKGGLTQEQLQALENFVSTLKNRTDEVKVKIEIKKGEVKTKMKNQFNLTEIEVEENVKKLENITGLTRIIQEKALDEIEEANETIQELKSVIEEMQGKNVSVPTNVLALYNESVKHLNVAIESYNGEKYGEAFGRAKAAEATARSALEFLERTEKKEVKEAKREFEAEIEEGLAKIKIKVNRTETKLIIPATSKEEIISKISEIIGLPPEEISKEIEIKTEEQKVAPQKITPISPVLITPLSPKPTTTPTQPTTQPTPTQPSKVPKLVTIEADDYGFYINNQKINNLLVKPGEEVIIIFKVRETGVYYGGLDFRSDYFKTESVKPGDETKVSFNSANSFTITSYWPASNVMKANLNVVVSEFTTPTSSEWYVVS
ncbi:MAG: DUF5667 domain-containing protein [Candidatus Aenigmatarchaeota archaeon]